MKAIAIILTILVTLWGFATIVLKIFDCIDEWQEAHNDRG